MQQSYMFISVVGFTVRPHYPETMYAMYLLNRSLNVPQNTQFNQNLFQIAIERMDSDAQSLNRMLFLVAKYRENLISNNNNIYIKLTF
jgi:hypothetical protein